MAAACSAFNFCHGSELIGNHFVKALELLRREHSLAEAPGVTFSTNDQSGAAIVAFPAKA
jgi:hypothetical protein